MAEATITAKQLAQEVGTDPKSFRRFLRSHLRGQDLETPGQGGRYGFTKGEAKRLIKAYNAWSTPKVVASPEATEDELSDEVEEFELEDELGDDEVEDDSDEAEEEEDSEVE